MDVTKIRAGAVARTTLRVVALCGLGRLLSAQVPVVRSGLTRPPLTLAAAVARAENHNPDLTIARYRVDSAHAERRIAAALPNPTFGAAPSNPTQYSVQLPLDVTVARHYRVETTNIGVRAARFDVLDAQRQVVFAVRQAFFDVLLADSLRVLASDQADAFRRLLIADSARLRSGGIAERDVVTTRLQLAHAEAQLARAVVQQHAGRLNLEMLLGDPPDTSLLIRGGLAYEPVELDADSILALAVGHRPDYEAASERIAQSASSVKLARANLIPVPVVGGVYQPSQPFTSGSHLAPSIGLTVPILYAFGGERARASASLASVRVTAERMQVQVRSDVTGAFDSYLSARMLAARYACGLLRDASAALDATRYAYDRGAIGLPDLLEAVRSYADTRSDYLTAVHDYWVSLFALERAAGIDFLPSAQ